MEKGKLIIDGIDISGSVSSAASVPYSNTNSGLEATNAQGAIDELASSVSEQNKNLGGFTPVIDEETGEITGYKTSIGGADTVFPFNNGNGISMIGITLSAVTSTNYKNKETLLPFNTAHFSKLIITGETTSSTYSLLTVSDSDGNTLYSKSGNGEISEEINISEYDVITIGYKNTYSENAFGQFVGDISFE